MDAKSGFRKVISQWMLSSLPKLMPRDIQIPTDISMIVSIVGPRRAGKTFTMYSVIGKLLDNIPKRNILYINFDNESLIGISVTDLDDLLMTFYELSNPSTDFPVYLFLDEIQVIPQWNKWVNRLYESKRFRIYISGSSSKLLSRELSTELRGRTIDFIVLPLSFREYINVKKIDPLNIDSLLFSDQRGEVKNHLSEFISYGGYPEITNLKQYRENILRTYFDTIIMKDVGERFHIEPSILKIFSIYCFSTYSKYISGTKVYNYLKTLNYRISHDYPLELIDHFSEVFFLFTLQIFSRSFKNAHQYPKKLYLIDTGMINEILGQEEIGKLIENVVFLELYRQQLTKNNNSINYWKEYGKSDGLEVDFVLSIDNKVTELINVSYINGIQDINPRETKALHKASRELNCNNLTIITWDYFHKGEINFVPLWYWLLKKVTV
jgi:predicted AAA+ superfamily ATPase